MSSNKVLVVGGAGYAGSVLVRELLERGYAVRVFDRLFFGDQGIREIRDGIELIVGDIRTADDSIFDDVSAVINISRLSNDPTAEYNPTANFEMNTIATEKLARQAKKAGISRFIFASSCSVYYVTAGADGLDLIMDETAAISPKAAYSYSKFEAEKRLLKWSMTTSRRSFCEKGRSMDSLRG